jgi:CBS domain-containing protein
LARSILANIIHCVVIPIVASSTILFQDNEELTIYWIAGATVLALVKIITIADLARTMIGSDTLAVPIASVLHSEIRTIVTSTSCIGKWIIAHAGFRIAGSREIASTHTTACDVFTLALSAADT